MMLKQTKQWIKYEMFAYILVPDDPMTSNADYLNLKNNYEEKRITNRPLMDAGSLKEHNE